MTQIYFPTKNCVYRAENHFSRPYISSKMTYKTYEGHVGIEQRPVYKKKVWSVGGTCGSTSNNCLIMGSSTMDGQVTIMP